jgi:hypothetical protein
MVAYQNDTTLGGDVLTPLDVHLAAQAQKQFDHYVG